MDHGLGLRHSACQSRFYRVAPIMLTRQSIGTRDEHHPFDFEDPRVRVSIQELGKLGWDAMSDRSLNLSTNLWLMVISFHERAIDQLV